MDSFGKFFTTVSCHKTKQADSFSVIIRVQFAGRRQDLYTGITARKEMWDTKRCRIKQGCKVGGIDYNVANRRIDEQVKFVEDYFNEHFYRGMISTLEDLKINFNSTFKKSSTQKTEEFFKILNGYIEDRSVVRTWTKACVEKWRRLSKHLKEFKPDIKFSDFSENLMISLLKYFSLTKKNDTVLKEFATLNEFLKWARNKKYPVNDEFFAFYNNSLKLEKHDKQVKFLTAEEVKVLIDMVFEDGSVMDITRDMFVFQCFTALRYSDLKNLKQENIYKGDDDQYYINLQTKKDKGRINFRLTKVAEKIYLKYQEKCRDKEYAFPVISLQKYNDHLKELGKLADFKGEWVDISWRLGDKIEEITPKTNLTTHVARRTFVCIAANAGVSLDKIASITSHADVNCMKPYLQFTVEGKDSVIQTLDSIFE